MSCDELAIMATGERSNYAIALEQVGWLQTFGTRRLALSFSGEKKMNLLSRIQNVLGTTSQPRREPAWLLGFVAVALPLVIVGASGTFPASNSAIAQEHEGRRSAESDAEPRRSPEAEGRRRSAEADAGPRRSPEAEARPRRSTESERGAARSPERDRPHRDAEDREVDVFLGVIGDFKPQTEREAVLFRMILQLQREIAAVRRDVRGREGDRNEHDGDRSRFSEGRGDREDSPRDRDAGSRESPARWESTKEGRVFKAYDKNSDGSVSLDEWLAMTNGNVSPARKEVQTKRYNEAEPNGDGKFTPGEFIYWYSKGRFGQVESNRRDGDGPKRGPRDGEESKRGVRDGDRAETPRNSRDGDGERQRGERDGDAEGRRGPRDGERESAKRIDGDREKDGDRDGETEE